MAKQSKALVPSVLAFSRKLEPSDGLMMFGLWENLKKSDAFYPISIYPKRNRGTKSQYGVSDSEKIDPNPVHVDDAVLPHNADTLRLSFTLKVLGNIEEPITCNDPEFERALKNSVENYRKTYQFKELATRYANNIANGRFLWRNRIGADSITIQVTHNEHTWEFDSYKYHLNQFAQSDGSDFDNLIKIIQTGLQGNYSEYLKIAAFAKIGFGQHIWPSQEMIMEKPKNGEKSKFLFQLGNCAAMHSEKIGNALRTIDTWYTAGSDTRPIAIEPYGSVPSRGDAYRIAKNDFYTLLDKWLADVNSVPEGQQHYIVATLIRGGVFGGKDD
ncbi:type I-F CRISPR-associated protein Csy3 [Nitrosomonas sp. Is37]|uniref:type I-F CRISPR-associated protein Csy3 n=1 Tax=Nitrosomonas sp. Is37 TaxID=3080535 RepID=UPI00294B4DB7|nr:type I-F CRISPR-associated protein Csy3 [Nitrosomonas sp. Is37]MDV6343164.1 type I-F CRISPR-associated protein Csy3 [Nitrosomonas sp. Is37]